MILRAILAAAALLLSLPGAASAQKMCNETRINTTVSPAARTEKVAGVPNKRIYFCGYMIVRTGTGTGNLEFELTSGNGLNCAGNRQVMIPKMAVPASGYLINRIAYAAGEKTLPGQAVCLEVFGSGATLVSTFYWAQF